MMLRAIVQILAWLCAIGLPALVTLCATSWIPKRWARNYARILIVPTLWFILSEQIFVAVDGRLDEGHWRCLVCGALEDRIAYAGWILRREPTPKIYDEIDSRPFERWYRREVGGLHSHDWVPIGCHSRGSAIACMKRHGEAFYRAVPLLPDESIARTMVNRIQRASVDERARLIEHFGYGAEDELFQGIAEGRVPPRDEFDGAFASWLAVHPEWN